MAVHLAIIGAGLGSTGTYYGIGEKLGFAPTIPTELSLTAVVVAAAGLVSARRVSLQVAFFALGALPAILSGVRAGLLSVVVVLLIYLLSSRLSARKIAIVVAAVVLVFVTGASDTITAHSAGWTTSTRSHDGAPSAARSTSSKDQSTNGPSALAHSPIRSAKTGEESSNSTAIPAHCEP